MPTTRLRNSNVIERGGERAFGAVYEYTNSCGRPVVVGSTSTNVEGAFVRDTAQHQSIRNLTEYEGGNQNVVWAGVGQYPLNAEAMQEITSSIVEQRSKKYQMQKLSGHKPYSKHGY